MRGLDVRIHDFETGSAREIIKLSGGESLVAALSLALGLSDNVEMTSEAIRLDTIFIADADTLNQVLQNIVG
jgi:exonuclease SbcC